eukprot:TRINITY_DN3381_c0_g1_i1.p3 TRINITY_DN3381_c0_g1~~TRINITY_DN3381_c0_g1_i1.p3  ORF type:complete len:264 (+),score=101.41 TRINITY_DN3381_c0_g1_i1:90-881(+)
MEFSGAELSHVDERAGLVMLVNEARRLAVLGLQKQCPLDYRQRLRGLNAKWAGVRAEVGRLLSEGHTPRDVRATLSGWYPFLGVIAAEEIECQRHFNEQWILGINARRYPASAVSQAGLRHGWVLCGNAVNAAQLARAAPPAAAEDDDRLPDLLDCDDGVYFPRFDSDVYEEEHAPPRRDPLDMPLITGPLLDFGLVFPTPPPLLPAAAAADKRRGADGPSPCPSSGDSFGEASSGGTSPRTSFEGLEDMCTALIDSDDDLCA